MIYDNITGLIGDTPLLKICPEAHGLKNIDLYAKLEYLSPFGSVKDRVAWGLLRDALQDMHDSGRRVLACGGGDMARAAQVLAAINGLDCEAVTNRLRQPESKAMLQFLGAQLEEHLGLSDYPDPDEEGGPMQSVMGRLENAGALYHYADEAGSELHPQIHAQGTGDEIADDLGAVDYLICAIGNAGTLAGASQRLRTDNPDMVSIGVLAPHGDIIPGVRGLDDNQAYGLYGTYAPDERYTVTANDAIEGMRVLARKCGVLGGPATGAAFIGATTYLAGLDENLSERRKAVFVAPDRLETHLSYVRTRRPELFAPEARPGTVAAIGEAEMGDVPVLQPEEVMDFIREKSALLIDMRAPVCYAAGHVPGAINIPDGVLCEILDQGRPFPEGADIVIVCARGNSARPVAAMLARQGYGAHVLDGGMMRWRIGDHPVEAAPGGQIAAE